MGKTPNYYSKILTILQELHKNYPKFSIGQHLSGALLEYGDLWVVSDKDIFLALEDYKLQRDNYIASDSEVQKIYNEGLHLDTMFLDEDEDY